MSNEHITNSMSRIINLRHISYSVFYLLLLWIYLVIFVYHNHYFVIYAPLHVYYCRRFLEVGDCIHKRIIQTSPRKMKQNQASTRKKKERRGVIDATTVPLSSLDIKWNLCCINSVFARRFNIACPTSKYIIIYRSIS